MGTRLTNPATGQTIDLRDDSQEAAYRAQGWFSAGPATDVVESPAPESHEDTGAGGLGPDTLAEAPVEVHEPPRKKTAKKAAASQPDETEEPSDGPQ